VEFLKQEHRVIERVLDALQHELPAPIDPVFMRKTLEFLAGFADGCHHHKEEEQLFPQLESRGVPRDGGPIGCVLDEHEAGRALMREMRESLGALEAGRSGADERFRSAATRYVALLRAHIFKEDNVLFELARRVLTCAERREMAAGFYDFERSPDQPGEHDKFVALAHELHRQAFGEIVKTACC
jgi:hemerythrin-like domain-containing protein